LKYLFCLQSISDYAKKRKGGYEHDWKSFLEHEPIKHLIKQWKGGKVLANDKQYHTAVSGALKTLGPTAIMHYGSQHATTQTKVCKA